jgi:hypothetical protein
MGKRGKDCATVQDQTLSMFRRVISQAEREHREELEARNEHKKFMDLPNKKRPEINVPAKKNEPVVFVPMFDLKYKMLKVTKI